MRILITAYCIDTIHNKFLSITVIKQFCSKQIHKQNYLLKTIFKRYVLTAY